MLDHLAEELGVLVFDSRCQRKLIAAKDGELGLSAEGEMFCSQLGDTRVVSFPVGQRALRARFVLRASAGKA